MTDDFTSYKDLKENAVNLLNMNIAKSVDTLQAKEDIEPKIISSTNYYETAGHEYAYEFYDLAKIEQTLKNIEYAESEDTLLQIIDISSSEIEKTNMNLFNIMDVNVDVLYKKDTDLLEEETIEKIYILKGSELIVENMLKGINANREEFARSVVETHNDKLKETIDYANERITFLINIRDKVSKDLNHLEENYNQMVTDSEKAIDKIRIDPIYALI